MNPARVHGREETLRAGLSALDAPGALLITGPVRAGVTAVLNALVSARDAPVVLRSTGESDLREMLYRALSSPVSDDSSITLATRRARTRLATHPAADPVPQFIAVCAALLRDLPVLVAFDDLHHCTSADHVSMLLDGLLDAGVELVLTARTDPISCGPDLAGVLTGLYRDDALSMLELPELSQDAVGAIAVDVLGAVPDAALIDEVARLSAGRAGAARDAVELLQPGAVTVVDGHAFLTAAPPRRGPLRLPAHHSLLAQYEAVRGETRALIQGLAAGEIPSPRQILLSAHHAAGNTPLAHVRTAGIVHGGDTRPRLVVPLLGEALAERLGPTARTQRSMPVARPAEPEPETAVITTVQALLAVRDLADAAAIMTELVTQYSDSAVVARHLCDVDSRVRAASDWREVAVAAESGSNRLGQTDPAAAQARLALLGCQIAATLRSGGLRAAQAMLAGATDPLGPEAMPLCGAILSSYAGEYRQADQQLNAYLRGRLDSGRLRPLREQASLLRASLGMRHRIPSDTPDAIVLQYFWAGRWHEALRLARRTEAFLTATPCGVPTLHRVCAAEIARHQGRVGDAQRWLRLEHGMPMLRHLRDWGQAGLHATLGDYAAALTAINSAITAAEDEDAPVSRGMLLGRKARIEYAADRVVAATETTAMLADLTEHGPRDASWFERLRTQASVLADAGAAAEALALAVRAGRPLPLAQAHTAAAACGLSPAANVASAISILDSLEATHTRNRAVAVLRQLGRRPRAEPKDAEGRTPTERLLTELIADGHSNATIARVIAVSEKRVEALIHAQLRQAGVSSRVELAQHQRAGRWSQPDGRGFAGDRGRASGVSREMAASARSRSRSL